MAGYESGLSTGSVLKKEIFFYEDDEIAWAFFKSMDWGKYESLKRNDRCLCGSGKKFKQCHMKNYLICERMMNEISNKVPTNHYEVSKNAIVERPIDKWCGYSAVSKTRISGTNVKKKVTK